tara:strand:- start:1235 stop:2659 length:1425 start_codon:yes stop_codon:yes gene_type:complete
MATTIQIKRSTGSAAPAASDLVEGELAYAEDRSGDGASAKLYISSIDSGSSEVIQAIGGKFYTDLLDNATNAATASTIVKRDSNGDVIFNKILYGNLYSTEGDLPSASTYHGMFAHVHGTGRGYFAHGGNWIKLLDESSFTSSGVFVDEDNMASDSASKVPSQQSVKAYVDAQVTASDLDAAGDSGTIDIDLDSESLTIAGGTGITTAASGTTITATLDDTAVTAGSYGSTTAVPVITVDAQGRITSASTSAISTSYTLAADSGSNDSVAGGETITFSGTANEIETTVSNNEITIGLPNNVTISGNLTVSGTTTTVDSTTLSVADPLISLATGNNSSDAVDIGLYGLYDTSGSTDLYSGLFRDANDSGKWKLFKDLQAAPTTTVNTGGTGYAVATLVANLESSSVTITGGSITGITDLVVADGGTGAGSFTSKGILYGNGTGALQVTAAGSEGQVLQAGSGGTPEFGGIDGGTY